MTPIEFAQEAFELYAGLSGDAGVDHLASSMSRLQVLLSRWQNRNFGAASLEQVALGVAEESGELAHAILKRSQRIRGMGDETIFRITAGDAVADCAIYLMQVATALRMDFGALVSATAEKVMQRDWKKNPAS